MVTDLQKRAAQAIVNVFETGRARGDYGRVTLMSGDSGHLTYGRSQTTLASGNLYLLIKDYCGAAGACLAAELTTYLKKLANCDFSLDTDIAFRRLLKEAGEDPVMQDVQDRFFDRIYWEPSVQQAEVTAISTGLGTGVVYDSWVHGSWGAIRNRTNAQYGLAKDIGENDWVSHYVEERRGWLANHSNALLHLTVYRMDAFRQLIQEGNWDLRPPFIIRGVQITEAVLLTSVRISAYDESERTLLLTKPLMRGEDVRRVQEALVRAGITVDVDGVFGTGTGKAVKQFQQQKGLRVDGIVGPATRSALGL